MKKSLMIAVGLALLCTSGPTFAAPKGGRPPPPRPRPNTEVGPAHRANTPSERTDVRQNRQGQRIDEGIKKGYLTTDEVSKLEAQQKSIETTQQAFKSDGKITRNEAQQLRQQLDEASRCIFAEKHDADGIAKPVYRLGDNVTLKNEIAQKLGDENLPKPAARAILNDFHRMMELKRILATATLNDAKRSQLQAEYNKLLNTYFVTK
jgi:hypothetical protein